MLVSLNWYFKISGTAGCTYGIGTAVRVHVHGRYRVGRVYMVGTVWAVRVYVGTVWAVRVYGRYRVDCVYVVGLMEKG